MVLSQLIPRKLWLDPNGKQLRQWPIEEIETLRDQNVQLSNQELKLGDHFEVEGITAAQVICCLIWDQNQRKFLLWLETNITQFLMIFPG